MPIYNYVCGKSNDERCRLSNLPEDFFDDVENNKYKFNLNLESSLMEFNDDGSINAIKSPIVWLENHGMFEDVNIKCPICGHDARKIISPAQHYIRGNCYLDINGCKRDMALHRLQQDDPYGHMRQPGEKDDLISRLKTGPKAKPMYFPVRDPKSK